MSTLVVELNQPIWKVIYRTKLDNFTKDQGEYIKKHLETNA